MLTTYGEGQDLRTTAAPRGGRPAVPALLLTLVVSAVLAAPSLAKTSATAPPDAQTVKAEVSQIAIGKDVKVKLANGRTLRGHLARIGENSFSVRTGRHGAERQIRYDEAAKVKDPGPIGWMLLGAAIVVIVIVVVH